MHGLHFTLVTDHEPLKWLMTSATLEGAHARWACILQEFDMTIQHRPGSKHCNADALSRLPLPSTEDRTGARLDHEAPASVVNACTATAAAVFPQESQRAALDLHETFPPHPLVTTNDAPVLGVRPTVQLSTVPLPAGVKEALHHGVTMYEPFGGLCAGLEAALKHGIQVHRYLYSDTSIPAQLVAKHRIAALALQ